MEQFDLRDLSINLYYKTINGCSSSKIKDSDELKKIILYDIKLKLKNDKFIAKIKEALKVKENSYYTLHKCEPYFSVK